MWAVIFDWSESMAIKIQPRSVMVSDNNVNKSLSILFGHVDRLFCYAIVISNHWHQTITSSIHLVLQTCKQIPTKMQTEPLHVYPSINGNVQNCSGSIFARTFSYSSIHLQTICAQNVSMYLRNSGEKLLTKMQPELFCKCNETFYNSIQWKATTN